MIWPIPKRALHFLQAIVFYIGIHKRCIRQLHEAWEERGRGGGSVHNAILLSDLLHTTLLCFQNSSGGTTRITRKMLHTERETRSVSHIFILLILAVTLLQRSEYCAFIYMCVCARVCMCACVCVCVCVCVFVWLYNLRSVLSRVMCLTIENLNQFFPQGIQLPQSSATQPMTKP